jgi:TRAP-type mannitol/chloroaromatic compound transport system substrate-binding protein
LFSLFGVINTYYDYAYYEDGEFSDIFRNKKLNNKLKKLINNLIDNIKRFFGYGK